MKKIIFYLLTCIAMVSIATAKELPPAPPESKPDLELSCDEADARIKLYKEKNDALRNNLNNLKKELSSTEKNLQDTRNNYIDCEEEILKLCGATKNDLEAFRQQLGVLEGKVRQMKGLSNDELADRVEEVKALETELNRLRGNKLSCIPEFYDKILSLARDIKGLYREKKITGYTVGTWAQDRDCLWNISGKMEIYGDPFQWPKIWQANTDQIRNPDIIHPGQVLKVPPAGPKTDEEAKAERRYWRQKRAAQEAAETNVTPGM
ncbi:MAG: LysM peptidoglycan-binding domain-containing protein [Candidatus Kapaibacterium sp.]